MQCPKSKFDNNSFPPKCALFTPEEVYLHNPKRILAVTDVPFRFHLRDGGQRLFWNDMSSNEMSPW